MWSLIEPCVGIVAGSLPYIRPLFQRQAAGASRATKPIRLLAEPLPGDGIWKKEDIRVEIRTATPFDELGASARCN